MKEFALVLALTIPWQAAATQEKTKEAPAAASAATAEAAEKIINKSLEASGGKAAYEKIKSRYHKATLEVKAMGMKATMESYTKMPNKKFEVTTIEGFGTFSQGYNGKTAWAKDPMNGLREMEGSELAMIKRDSVFNSEIHWKEVYKEAKATGQKTTVDGKEVYEVEFTPNEGKNVTIYYDATTYLPVMQKVIADTPQGTVPVKMVLSDYREVDGIKVPFSVQQLAGPQEVSITISEVKHNVDIDDKKFDKPADEEEKAADKPASSEKKPN